ncbi:SpoIVB peptidase S55 domain-containing protein [Selenihalanaerobacter shriftii]|uniref:SpoIVB peptidase S55 n=1 Tax=Selenihalanaerobacter shriftii TaxID=142842 RepID=A0A1T4KZD2_9FIRM|nr:SpoIVB peptidase S55 domain-containing protein [Selenihalanaerobacter shriftii]SJZ47670.1 SpoIVB peptidase S55 [Selenihalanaerobacter shriftii]
MYKRWFIVIGLVISLLISLPALATNKPIKRNIMPVNQVKRDMTGIGKTVISGTKIEEFNVKVLGILKNQKVNQDLILVKVSGDLIEETGGIAAGMSGSPVYIDGKLIGAIGYGWQLTEHKIGMVTPIEDMINIWKLDKINNKKTAFLSDPIKVAGQVKTKVRFMNKEPRKITEQADNELLAYPAKTPLLVNGLGRGALDYLSNELQDYGLKPVQGGGVTQSQKKKIDDELKPGSAIAVQLVRGDIDVSAIGTLTYKEDDRVLGFGHRFMNKGESNYFLSSAYIHQMIKSLEMPFKLGAPLNLKGIITQDRTAGVGGKVGEFPKVVPLEVKVTDQDLNRTRDINVQLVRDEDLIQPLAGSVVYQAISSTIDRQGGGTAEVEMEIMANNLDEKIIKRKNIFYNRGDVAAVALNDFLKGLALITQNPFQKINLIDIKLNIKIKEEPQVALIEEVNFSQQKVKPGEEIEFKVKLRPYRKESIVEKYSFKVPENIDAGKVNIEIIGGREANFTSQQEVTKEETEYGHGKNETFKDLEEVIDTFKEQKINSELVIRVYPSYEEEAIPVSGDNNSKQSQISHQRKELSSKASDNIENEGSNVKANEEIFEESFSTNYILEGRVDTELEIQPKDKNKSKDKEGKKVTKPQVKNKDKVKSGHKS